MKSNTKTFFEDVEDLNDNAFYNLLKVNNNEGMVKKEVRKEILTGYINKYLEKHNVCGLIKIILDCVPTGYVARMIIKIRNKCKEEL